MVSSPAAAPPAAVHAVADTTDTERFEAAVQLWEEGRVAEARRRLDSLWQADRAFYVRGTGSLAYWYGRAIAETGDTLAAVKVWQVGLTSLNLADRFDPRVNDAYVRAVFRTEKTGLYPQASAAYLDLFEQADQVGEEDPDARRVIDRHVSQMAFLLEEPARRRLLREVDQETVVASAYALRPGKGPALAGWWRGQDPVPPTGRNERVEEHLRRVMIAEEKYAFEDRWRGFDERGKVYVRLGAPGQTRDVSLTNLRRYRFPGIPIKAIETQLPQHEIWFYPSHGEDALYIFVWRQGRYRLSGPQDLLPPDVRGPYDFKRFGSGQEAMEAGERGEAKHALLAMESILRELRMNSEYNRLFEDIADYVNNYRYRVANRQEAAEMRAPAVFAQTAQLDGEKTRRQVVHVRQKTVPQQETEVGKDLPTVPVQLRRARFLDDDGTTRTLLYWTHPAEDMSRNALFDVTAVQRQVDYSRTQQRSRRYVMDPGEEGLQAWVLPMHGGEGTYHLHLQVDQYEVKGVPEAGGVRRGEQSAQTVVRFDSLEALETDPDRLVMSDLLPGVAPSRAATPSGQAAQMSLSPYPHGALLPGIDLRIYFELYGLTYGAEDRTRYSVGYTVRKRREGGVFPLFRDRETETTTESTYEGTSRRTQEYIQLQLGEIDDAEEVRITVRVTDEVVGRTVERSLTFNVAK